MWRFTKHALFRMQERGYTEDEVLLVLYGEAPTIVYPSPREATVDLFFGRVAGKFMMIPVDREKETVITIRPMRDKEKEIYLKEVKHDKE
jgi:hypothetical protein